MVGGAIYRDRVQAVGRIPVLSNSKEGTLEFITDPTAPDPDPKHSPWEGMSGAAVWARGYVIGVVSKHHPGDSLTRLAVARLRQVDMRAERRRTRKSWVGARLA